MQWKRSLRFLSKGGAEANANAQREFYQTLTNNYNQIFGQFQQVFATLQSQVQGLMNGTVKTPYGFSKDEDTALRTDATNQTASAYAKAGSALNNQLAAQGGGDTYMPSGAADQLKAQLAASGAQAAAKAQTDVTEKGYEVGRENYLGGLSTLANSLNAINPNAFAGAATNQGNAATSAIKVANETSLGGWGSILGAAVGGATSALTSGLMGGFGGGNKSSGGDDEGGDSLFI